MKNKFINIMIILFLSFGLLFGLASCGDDNQTTNIEEEKYNIIIPTVDNGTITASTTTVKNGDSVELTVTPYEYYKLDYLKANDVELTVTNNKATINDIQTDQIITAAFSGVDVVVTFVADGATVDTKTLKYGDFYGDLPTVVAPEGFEFKGWYTEESGTGLLITKDSLVTNGEAHSIYANFETLPVKITVSGIKNRLVHLPGMDSETLTLDVTVLEGNLDITSKSNVKIESSDSDVVFVDGFTLKIADGANGSASIKVLVDGVEVKSFDINAIDYNALGYIAVNTKEEFLAMTGTNKYVLTNDIVIDGWLSTSDYKPLIDKLSFDAVIDGNGHTVSGAKLPGGWNNSWIKEVYGTIRNIAFINLITADSNAFSTGLVGFLKDGALLEDVFVDALIVSDGAFDAANKSGGVLIGTLEAGTIKNVVLNVNLKEGIEVESYGAFAAIIPADSKTKVYNSYAIINHSYLRPFGNEYKYGTWDNAITDDSGIFDSKNTFLNKCNEENLFINNVWQLESDKLLFGDNEVLISEEEYSGYLKPIYYFTKNDEDQKINFEVYYYGELTNEYVVNSYDSSNEEIFTVDKNGVLSFIGSGEAVLTITINDSLILETTIYVKPDYYLITTVEEFRTLLAFDPTWNFKLGNNIDFKGEYFAVESDKSLISSFSGVFDGDGYAIMNAVVPGGWKGHSLIETLSGTFKNVAFINTNVSPLCTNTAIIGDNKGLIENVFVDYVINSDGRQYGFGGVIAGYAGIGIMRNCVTNIRLNENLDTAPSFYGSIFGHASNWHGVVQNCYSIVHNTGVKEIGASEAANGVMNQYFKQGSKQYQTYTQLKTFADTSMYDKSLWTFAEDKIVFGHNVVYTLQDDDLCSYISTPEDFISQIEKNPDGKFRLAKDLDFNGMEIEFENDIIFTGELDGMGCIISNAVMGQNNLFAENSGVIKNIAFVNLNGPKNGKEAGLVKVNKGIIDNVFVDFVLNSDGSIYDYAGVLAADGADGTISSTIVNIRAAEDLTRIPSFYGSIVGKVTADTKIKNTYAVINDLEIANIAIIESEEGLIDSLKAVNCNQYAYYSDIKKNGEDFKSFNSSWKFTNSQIKYNNQVVLTDKTQDEYIYISTVDEWLTLIPADPTAKFKLKNDIDFNGKYITGKDAKYLTDKFTGVLDGQGYKIMNAKMPGGWAGHSIFNYNEGEIRNIAFINTQASPVTTQNSLFNINRGIIENLYVDYVLYTSTYESTYNGVICTFADNQLSNDKPSIIRNCIVNVKLADGAQLPSCQGSIVGKAGGWTGYVYNCYAIINNTGIENVYFDPNGTVAASTCNTSKQFESYELLKAGADTSMYDTAIWNFTDTAIVFFGRSVYGSYESGEEPEQPVIPDIPDDGYTYIKTVADWLTLIASDPTGKFRLANDLDFKGEYITGKNATFLAAKFTGELDGQGYQIKNAKMPGGWNGHAIFDRNEGIIKNIAFINITANAVTTQNALINNNLGIIENLYVDYILTSSTYESSYNGVIAALANNPVSGSDIPSEIRNCIVNVRLAEGASLPSAQGSIVGKAGGWNGFVKNCYALVNNTGVNNIYHSEAASGVAAYACGTSAQFNSYADAVASTDISMYDTSIWTFSETSISFFGNVVYQVSE